jgi:hypothetical protein
MPPSLLLVRNMKVKVKVRVVLLVFRHGFGGFM